MVKYSKKRTKNYKTARDIPADTIFVGDPGKFLNKTGNHKEVHPIDFSRMEGRPLQDDPLPCYMKGITSRQSQVLLTDKSLKLNNYSEAKFVDSQSSFFPKKSFNKIINLNLMNSKKFLSGVGMDMNLAKDDENAYIQKSLKFYS